MERESVSLEVYDLDAVATSAVANLSIRGSVEHGDSVTIAGVITAGDESLPVIVRLRAVAERGRR